MTATFTSRVGVGVIGLGSHAVRSHIEPLSDVAGCELVAVCDTNPDTLAAFDPSFTGGRYHNSMELMADPAVDAVIVCTPDRFHAALLHECVVVCGKHCLVEKPLADSSQDLELVERALRHAARHDLVITSCHPRRFDPPYLWLDVRDAELRSQLGSPLDVRMDFAYHEPSKQGLHLGLLLDHANHELDLLHFVFGANSMTAYRLYDSETRYALAGARDDGITFEFHGSRSLAARRYAELVRVRYQLGELEVDCETGQATILDFETMTRTVEPCPTTDYATRFEDLNRNFIDAIRGEADNYLTAEELLLNIQVGIELTRHGVFRYARPVDARRRRAA